MKRASRGESEWTRDEAMDLVASARRRGDAIAIISAASARVILITPSAPNGAADDLLPLADAARIAARVLRGEIRAGHLAAYGGQRDRAVRRDDLCRWIEGRAVKPHAPIDDDDIERRMRRISAARGRQ